VHRIIRGKIPVDEEVNLLEGIRQAFPAVDEYIRQVEGIDHDEILEAMFRERPYDFQDFF